MEHLNLSEKAFMQWQAGDPEALNLFFEAQYQTTFLPLAQRLVRYERDRTLTDLDLVHNAFMALQRAKKPFDSAKDAVAYAAVAMKNDLRDKGKRVKNLSLDDLLKEGGLL